jgi:Spy/CpxP family protein refolding chaperone
MKSVKIILSVLALSATAFVTTGSAQEKKGRGQMSPEARIAAIEEAVGDVSADQKAKITAILEKTGKQVMALPQEERREKGREIMMAANKEVRAVLTPAQQAKFDAMAPQGGKGGGEKGGGKKKN